MKQVFLEMRGVIISFCERLPLDQEENAATAATFNESAASCLL